MNDFNPNSVYNDTELERVLYSKSNRKFSPGHIKVIQHFQNELGLQNTKINYHLRPLPFKAKGFSVNPPYKGSYRIVLNDSNDDVEMYMSIAHELRHIWQFSTNRLITDTLTGRIYWNGAEIDERVGYENSPDEIDARRYMAKGLEVAVKLGVLDYQTHREYIDFMIQNACV